MRSGPDLNWMITAFADQVSSAAHAVVVSADGLPVACSEGLPAERVDQLAAITAGLTGLARGAARIFDGGHLTQTVVQMQQGALFLMLISDGAALTVLADGDCDMRLVAYEMALLAKRAGDAFTPEARGPQPVPERRPQPNAPLPHR